MGYQQVRLLSDENGFQGRLGAKSGVAIAPSRTWLDLPN